MFDRHCRVCLHYRHVKYWKVHNITFFFLSSKINVKHMWKQGDGVNLHNIDDLIRKFKYWDREKVKCLQNLNETRTVEENLNKM